MRIERLRDEFFLSKEGITVFFDDFCEYEDGLINRAVKIRSKGTLICMLFLEHAEQFNKEMKRLRKEEGEDLDDER